MKKTSKKVIFFGTENFSADSLQRLIDAKYDVAVVVTKPDSIRGRGKKIIEPKVKQIAKAHNINVWQPEKLEDIKQKIKAIDSRIGVLVSYGKIIPAEILELFEPLGIINIHPSFLPKYRGPSPIETAILNGDSKIGISFIKLSEKMDAGPIYDQANIKINSHANAKEIYETISSIASTKLLEILPGIIEGRIKPRVQDDSQATYTDLLKKEDGEIDWLKSAQQIDREIRAYINWPKSRTKLAGTDVIITSARLDSQDIPPGQINIKDKKIIVGCGQGSLEILRLKPAGKNEMSAESFLAGYRF